MAEDILDHFTLDSSYLYLKYHPKAYIASAFKALRMATGYRPHYYTAPGPDSQPIPALNAVLYEIKMIPGTIIWGLTFWDGAQLPEAFNLLEKTGRKLSSEPIPADIFVANSSSTGIWYLDEPFTVGTPGLMQVELYNGNSGTSGFNTQLIVCTAQPQARKDVIV